jgi:hypothetical protein
MVATISCISKQRKKKKETKTELPPIAADDFTDKTQNK